MKVVVVGCGVVGAAIAYELSQIPELQVTVLDSHFPAQGATGASLGVLMGAISQKAKGRNLRMRLDSIQQYNSWIPQLEAITGRIIPFNQAGILRLCFEAEDLEFWRSLAQIRRDQGWHLEVCDRSWLASHYPQLSLEQVMGAVYSPQDRQVDPTALTLALVDAAKHKGATFQFGVTVTGADSFLPTKKTEPEKAESELQRCRQIQTTAGNLELDWLVIAAGLGSTPLTVALQQPVDIRPVLGQAAQVQLAQPLGNLQPVITGADVHIVPLEQAKPGAADYWIGATVEFPDGTDPTALTPDTAALETVMQKAIALCPALANATILRSWSGLRPRPEGRPAPIIESLRGYQNVLLATGHYRNGVLLAPATAMRVREAIYK